MNADFTEKKKQATTVVVFMRVTLVILRKQSNYTFWTFQRMMVTSPQRRCTSLCVCVCVQILNFRKSRTKADSNTRPVTWFKWLTRLFSVCLSEHFGRWLKVLMNSQHTSDKMHSVVPQIFILCAFCLLSVGNCLWTLHGLNNIKSWWMLRRKR